MSLPDSDWFQLASLMRQHDIFNDTARQADARILQGLDGHAEQIRLLETIPGISLQAACDILVEIGGGMDSFASTGAFSTGAGVSPGNSESAGKRRSARSVRGSPHLRTVLTECALAAPRTRDWQFKGCHKAIHVRRGYQRTTVATAHKLLRTICSVLKNQSPCRDPDFDCEAVMVHCNAARWIRKLDEYGYWPCTSAAPKTQAA
ncbi:MAG: transposase [Gammaproteobacteria bacterium]|nr:transposase [Gammaproteobacteria bacterium]